MAALALARSGAGLAGVVSIHGSLATSAPARPGAVTAKVLACHGAADPHVPPADVAAFAAEMNHAEADWQLVMYGRALHGFTHRHAVPGATPAWPTTSWPTSARSPPPAPSWPMPSPIEHDMRPGQLRARDNQKAGTQLPCDSSVTYAPS